MLNIYIHQKIENFKNNDIYKLTKIDYLKQVFIGNALEVPLSDSILVEYDDLIINQCYIDDIMEEINNIVLNAYKSINKQVIIVKGGPGTGKSVLALNALGELLSLGLVGSYVSKNMAPRKVYKNILSTPDNTFSVNDLFKSSGFFFRERLNKYDFLLVDEAHRLQEKSGIRNNVGENQIKEIIEAAKCSIFFVDEHQAITLKDIGSIQNISYFAKELDANKSI